MATPSLREPSRITLTLADRKAISEQGKKILTQGGRYGPPKSGAIVVTLPWSLENKRLAIVLLETYGGRDLTIAGESSPPLVKHFWNGDALTPSAALTALEEAYERWWQYTGTQLEAKRAAEAATAAMRKRFKEKAKTALQQKLAEHVISPEGEGERSFWLSLDGVDFEVTISDVRID